MQACNNQAAIDSALIPRRLPSSPMPRNGTARELVISSLLVQFGCTFVKQDLFVSSP